MGYGAEIVMKRPYEAVSEIMGRIERVVRARLQDVGYLPERHPARALPIELLPQRAVRLLLDGALPTDFVAFRDYHMDR